MWKKDLKKKRIQSDTKPWSQVSYWVAYVHDNTFYEQNEISLGHSFLLGYLAMFMIILFMNMNIMSKFKGTVCNVMSTYYDSSQKNAYLQVRFSTCWF